MKAKAKNTILSMIYALCIGAIIGFIIWLFMRIMDLGIECIWNTIPNMIQIPFYTIIVCTFGGLIIGIWRKLVGDYPENLETIMEKVKKTGGYEYEHLGRITISALLPLVFGGSVGLESGLSGIIAGLCSWAGDKFKHLFKEMKELTQIGISATLGTIFNSPMFGFVRPIEGGKNGVTLPKKAKIVLYFLSIFGAFGAMMLLNDLIAGGEGMASFSGLEISSIEWVWLIPLSIIGIISGYFYSGFNKLITKVGKPLKKYPMISSIIAGVILGIAGTVLPFILFSGEYQMADIANNWQEIGLAVLLLTGIVKIFITNTCIILGFKGGNGFPSIFAGICIGYAMALVTGINPVFCVCVVTTALLAYLIKRPVATVLLLMICFPMQAVVPMLFAAVVGSAVVTPKFLKVNNEAEDEEEVKQLEGAI